MYKISICTVCMNRLAHLRVTLPKNISDNLQYPNIEFVVLDYNSKDGMEKWVQTNLQKHIESGVLKYYKTDEPEYFNLSHSKNMALKLATGDVLCMVDADNYAGENYAAWVNSVFTAHGKDTIITTLRKDHIPLRDQGGKLCFGRELFKSVKGFDEALVGYGIDDVDLVNRLEKLGGKRVFIENQKFLKYIGHSNVERLKNHSLMNNLENIYLQVSESMATQNRVLYLLRDNSFFQVNFEFKESLKSNQMLSYAGWVIEDDGHRKGIFKRSAGDGLSLIYDDGSTFSLCREDNGVMTSTADRKVISWRKLSMNDELFYGLIMGYGECMNRVKYIENDRESSIVNRDGWGRATVYLNFDRSKAITV